jgi:hypothetical protein
VYYWLFHPLHLLIFIVFLWQKLLEYGRQTKAGPAEVSKVRIGAVTTPYIPTEVLLTVLLLFHSGPTTIKDATNGCDLYMALYYPAQQESTSSKQKQAGGEGQQQFGGKSLRTRRWKCDRIVVVN